MEFGITIAMLKHIENVLKGLNESEKFKDIQNEDEKYQILTNLCRLYFAKDNKESVENVIQEIRNDQMHYEKYQYNYNKLFDQQRQCGDTIEKKSLNMLKVVKNQKKESKSASVFK